MKSNRGEIRRIEVVVPGVFDTPYIQLTYWPNLPFGLGRIFARKSVRIDQRNFDEVRKQIGDSRATDVIWYINDLKQITPLFDIEEELWTDWVAETGSRVTIGYSSIKSIAPSTHLVIPNST